MKASLRTAAAVLTSVVLTAIALSGCGSGNGSSSGSHNNTLTLYNGQHPQTTQVLVNAFEKASGIHVNVKDGDNGELANQILAEGSASPADVLYTEDSPDLSVVQAQGKFAKVDAATLSHVPAKDSSAKGEWVGVTARSVALVYSPKLVAAKDLPTSILDLAKPQWKGKIGIEPSSGSFQAVVTAVRLLKGTGATKAWLAGLQANAKTYNHHDAILQAVNANQLAIGLINNYYWYRARAATKSHSLNSKLLYLGDKDPGALVNISGAGILKSAPHPAAAQKFLAYITSPAGQRIIAHSDSFEYTLNPAAASNPEIRPLSTLNPPAIDLGALGSGQDKSLAMLQQAGFSL